MSLKPRKKIQRKVMTPAHLVNLMIIATRMMNTNPEIIEDQTAGQLLARTVGLAAGLPITKPGMTNEDALREGFNRMESDEELDLLILHVALNSKWSPPRDWPTKDEMLQSYFELSHRAHELYLEGSTGSISLAP